MSVRNNKDPPVHTFSIGPLDINRPSGPLGLILSSVDVRSCGVCVRLYDTTGQLKLAGARAYHVGQNDVVFGDPWFSDPSFREVLRKPSFLARASWALQLGYAPDQVYWPYVALGVPPHVVREIYHLCMRKVSWVDIAEKPKIRQIAMIGAGTRDETDIGMMCLDKTKFERARAAAEELLDDKRNPSALDEGFSVLLKETLPLLK